VCRGIVKSDSCTTEKENGKERMKEKDEEGS